MLDFGKWLKAELKKQNILIKEIAVDIGVAPVTISTWIRENRSASLENAEKAINYLGYELQIVEAKEEKKRKTVNEWLFSAVYKKAYTEGYTAGKKERAKREN